MSATYKAKLIREMERDKEIHDRGHYVVSERQLIDTIVVSIQNQRELKLPVDIDPIDRVAKDALTDMQG